MPLERVGRAYLVVLAGAEPVREQEEEEEEEERGELDGVSWELVVRAWPAGLHRR